MSAITMMPKVIEVLRFYAGEGCDSWRRWGDECCDVESDGGQRAIDLLAELKKDGLA